MITPLETIRLFTLCDTINFNYWQATIRTELHCFIYSPSTVKHQTIRQIANKTVDTWTSSNVNSNFVTSLEVISISLLINVEQFHKPAEYSCTLKILNKLPVRHTTRSPGHDNISFLVVQDNWQRSYSQDNVLNELWVHQLCSMFNHLQHLQLTTKKYTRSITDSGTGHSPFKTIPRHL